MSGSSPSIDELLEQYPEKPLDVFLELLSTPLFIADLSNILDFVCGPRCGINRRTTSNEELKALGITLGTTPLMLSVLACRLDIMKALLAKGADPHMADDDGRTALHAAAAMGLVKAIQALVDMGSDVNAVDKHGKTSLHWATNDDHAKAVKLLIEKGANINAVQIGGCTPLQNAISNGHLASVQVLLRHGADVNASDDYGFSPLHLVPSWCLAVASELLDCGANVNAIDNEGRTPLYKAHNCHGNLAQILKTGGGEMGVKFAMEHKSSQH